MSEILIIISMAIFCGSAVYNIACYAFDIPTREETRIKAVEYALKLIARGKLTLEEVAEDSGLTLEEVKELAQKQSA